jgi:hypothetical protein
VRDAEEKTENRKIGEGAWGAGEKEKLREEKNI